MGTSCRVFWDEGLLVLKLGQSQANWDRLSSQARSTIVIKIKSRPALVELAA